MSRMDADTTNTHYEYLQGRIRLVLSVTTGKFCLGTSVYLNLDVAFQVSKRLGPQSRSHSAIALY